MKKRFLLVIILILLVIVIGGMSIALNTKTSAGIPEMYIQYVTNEDTDESMPLYICGLNWNDANINETIEIRVDRNNILKNIVLGSKKEVQFYFPDKKPTKVLLLEIGENEKKSFETSDVTNAEEISIHDPYKCKANNIYLLVAYYDENWVAYSFSCSSELD